MTTETPPDENFLLQSQIFIMYAERPRMSLPFHFLSMQELQKKLVGETHTRTQIQIHIV